MNKSPPIHLDLSLLIMSLPFFPHNQPDRIIKAQLNPRGRAEGVSLNRRGLDLVPYENRRRN